MPLWLAGARGDSPASDRILLLPARYAQRFDWSEQWKTTVRADLFYDQTQALSPMTMS